LRQGTPRTKSLTALGEAVVLKFKLDQAMIFALEFE
jgi:hypothetical protein